MNVVDALQAAIVRDTEGAEVLLASLWQERAVVLVFVRHFG